jgi:hypothetical protein
MVSQHGGWFSNDLRVQVRRNGTWIDVQDLSISPPYVFSKLLPSHQVTTFRFETAWGDGIRIVGTPGGDEHFTSIGQLAAYFDTDNLIDDDSFEFQHSPELSGVWRSEGAGTKGITRFEQRGHSGVNHAWLESTGNEWNAVVQTVAIRPQTNYRLSAWVRCSFDGPLGRLGVRKSAKSVITETTFSKALEYRKITSDFNSGSESMVDVYVGLRGNSLRHDLDIDDVKLEPR